ncbi:hypothetical protein BH11MYX1_BH11MYX1_27940 [soil metagenome]
MPVKHRFLALALIASLPLLATPAWAKKDPKKAAPKAAAKADKSDDDSDDDDADKKPAKAAPKAAAEKSDKSDDDSSDPPAAAKTKPDDDTSADDDDGGGFSGKAKQPSTESSEPPMVKQDLNGHDMGSKKKTTEFEKDRFFVDKADTEKTEGKTLIQGSLTSSTLLFKETGGGAYPELNTATGGKAANGDVPSRLFTDLRLQTDFRHISGGRWDARIDGRIRLVSQPDFNDRFDTVVAATPAEQGHIQSGLLGKNEYDLRELWLVRNGTRTDLTFGRQYIADLAAVKVDGLRFDYASTAKLTYLGFAGLFPFRGSRSVDTDYVALKDPVTGKAAGQFIGTGGFGAAYRTATAYGAFGGVVQQAIDGGDQTRIFGTANGYFRVNPVLDLYHFLLIDLVATNGGAQITNASGGLNYKPNQRLRMTLNLNHVDTETLAIQAGAFLDAPQPNQVVQNQIMISRLATESARGSISAGLGNLERFEITVAASFRRRPAFNLAPVTPGTAALNYRLPGERGYEVSASVLDRHSIKDARIGVEALQTFGSGGSTYNHEDVFVLRGFVGHDLMSGRGEWEVEASYSTTKDINVGVACAAVGPADTCFGSAKGTVISGGGTLYYRINHDWFLIGQAFISHQALTAVPVGTTQPEDPAVNDLTGYFRIAYRF